MTPIKYLWHLNGERWERAFDRINTKTIKGIHQKFLGAADQVKEGVRRGLSKFKKKR